MLGNCAIEAVKWEISIHNIQPFRFLTSFKAVLSGVSFSVNTPNRVGEYLGRVLYVHEGHRLRVISLTIVCSMSQLIITLVAGTVALITLYPAINKAALLPERWLTALTYLT